MRVTAVLFFILSISAAAFAQDRVLWDEQFDAAGGGDIARAIAVTGKTVVVTGGTSTAAGTEMAVRSYNKKTGKVRWSDSTPLVNGVQTAVYATKVAGVVYTAGYAPNGVGSDIDVHAYDAKTGAHLWQDVLDRGRDDFPRDLAGNQADNGAGKHFGDPSMTIGFDLTYLPWNLTFDLGTVVTQYFLEPYIHEGVDHDLLFTVRWNGGSKN